MAKKRSMAKIGRAMNPADRERKQARLKELKKNKKQRNIVRQTIVKSRNPEELIEQLQHLDDQEFDPSCTLAANVIADKREKYKGAFVQMLSLYRTEKNDKKVRYLENLMQDYEKDRYTKEQHHKAVMFSKNTDLLDIPLPSGSMFPDAAMTPFSLPPPMPPVFHPTMVAKASILKKPVVDKDKAKPHKYPPGPPCGLPPDLGELEEEEDHRRGLSANRKVRFQEEPVEEEYHEEDDDFEPVDIPDDMMLSQEEPPMIYQPVFPMPSLMSAPPMPPNMVPLPPIMPGRVPIPPMRAPRPDYSNAPFSVKGSAAHLRSNDVVSTSNVISAAPQVNKPKTDVPATAAVISAEPQMRNMKKEATRFVPTTLRVQRNEPPKPKRNATIQNRSIPKPSGFGSQAKSADEACEEFLKEIQGLL